MVQLIRNIHSTKEFKNEFTCQYSAWKTVLCVDCIFEGNKLRKVWPIERMEVLR